MSKWKVVHLYEDVAQSGYWKVYRLIDETKPDVPENREYAGNGYANPFPAKELARKLNEEEA